MSDLRPTTSAELQHIVREERDILVRGGGSKPALSGAVAGVTTCRLDRLAGLLAYDPNEYTFTAYAGTTVADIDAALAENGQYLPFDPLLLQAGATLGGTVAANAGGSGSLRYGSVRDFILGVRFVDGLGRIIQAGGKVVKNAAGFDLPKFMCGSLGRYGVLTELTFKVFPRPEAFITLQLDYDTVEQALRATYRLAAQPIELEAVDLEPSAEGRARLNLRLGGLADGLQARLQRLTTTLQDQTAVTGQHIPADDTALWQAIRELQWAGRAPVIVKVPLAPRQLPALETAVRALCPQRRYTLAGNIAWLATREVDALDLALRALDLPGLVLQGPAGRVYLGSRPGAALARRVKAALDPQGRFLPDDNWERLYAASD